MTNTVDSYVLGIGLSGRQSADLLNNSSAVDALSAAKPTLIIVGLDRLSSSSSSTHTPTFDPSIAVAALSKRLPDSGLLLAAAPHRDHPYNLARRTASLDHFTGGRAGIVLGQRDYTVPKVADDLGEAWGGAGLGNGRELGELTVADAGLALQKLWQSWPLDSIQSDPDTLTIVRSEEIRRIDHRGAFEISGPLTLPSTPQGTPLLFAHVTSALQWAALRDVSDGAIVPADVSSDLLENLLSSTRSRVLLQQVDAVGDVDTVVASIASALATGIDGIVLTTSAEQITTGEFTGNLLRAITNSGELPRPLRLTTTLRESLGVPGQPDRLTNAAPAFGDATSVAG